MKIIQTFPFYLNKKKQKKSYRGDRFETKTIEIVDILAFLFSVIDLNDFVFHHFHVSTNRKQSVIFFSSIILGFTKSDGLNFSVMDSVFSNKLPFFWVVYIEQSVIWKEKKYVWIKKDLRINQILKPYQLWKEKPRNRYPW